MKKSFLISTLLMVGLFVFISFQTKAQVTIGANTTPDPASVLDIISSTKGVSFPQINLISTTTQPSGTLPKSGTVIYNSNAGVTGATANGAGLYYWDGAKWVWFNTNSPTASVSWLLNGNANGSVKTIGTNDANDLPFVTSSTERMRLTTSGMLGIGTKSPTVGLHVRSNIDALSDVIIEGLDSLGTSTPSLQLNHTTTAASLSANTVMGSIGFGGRVNSTNTSNIAQIQSVYRGNNGTTLYSDLRFSTTQLERMRIDTNGYVGINTTTPTAALQVVNNGGIDSRDDIVITSYTPSSGGSTPAILLERAHGTATTPAVLTNGAQLGSMQSWGYFGSTPSFQPLSNIFSNYTGNGTTALSTMSFATSNGSSSQNVVRMILDEAGNLYPNLDNAQLLGKSGNRWSAVWAANGGIQTSDIRLKTNITPLTYGLNEILKLDPISYSWKNDNSNKMKLGLSAQQLQSVLPEVVVEGDDADKTLGVYYSDIIPYLSMPLKNNRHK